MKNEPANLDSTARTGSPGSAAASARAGLGPVIVASANLETMEWVRRHHPDAVTGVEAGEGESLWDWIDYSAGQGHTFLMPTLPRC